MNDKKGFFGDMSPNATFVFGLVSGLALMLIFGSGISLPSFSGSESGDSNPIAVRDTAPAPTPAAPRGSGSAANVPPVTAEDHVLGDADAPITWIEYSDYECPFCKRFHPTMVQMVEDYAGQVKWVYRHFPLSFHEPLASQAATAAECAGELGGGSEAFFAYSDLYFERTNSNGRGLDVKELIPMAGELGINEKKFETCLNSGKYDDHIASDLNGGSAAGVSGTPGSIVIDSRGNAELVSGAVPYNQVSAILDELVSQL